MALQVYTGMFDSIWPVMYVTHTLSVTTACNLEKLLKIFADHYTLCLLASSKISIDLNSCVREAPSVLSLCAYVVTACK